MKVIFEGSLAEPYRPLYPTPGEVEGKISAIVRAPGRPKSGNCQHEDRRDLWKGNLHLSFHRSSEFFLNAEIERLKERAHAQQRPVYPPHPHPVAKKPPFIRWMMGGSPAALSRCCSWRRKEAGIRKRSTSSRKQFPSLRIPSAITTSVGGEASSPELLCATRHP